MKTLKKKLCLTLCFSILFGTLVTSATAANFTDADKIVNKTAVETLVKLNVMNGTANGDSFDPTGNLSRAEMCKIITVAFNGGKDPTLRTQPAPTYLDIKGHWAEAYIEYCSALGIVSGMGNGTFDPDGTVTGVQAAKMLLIIIGFDAENEAFTSRDWAIKVNVRAIQKGIYDNLTLDPMKPLCRDDSAQMTYNALNATLVYYENSMIKNNGGLDTMPVLVEDKDGSTMLSKKFDITP